MRWASKTYDARLAPKKEWHVWFAWYPITMKTTGEGASQRFHNVWLSRIERRLLTAYPDCYRTWAYREINHE